MVIAGEVFVGEEVHDCWEICSWNLWTKLNSRAGKHLNRPREGPVVKLYTWDLAILQQDWHKILYVNAIDVENLPPFPFISPLTYSVWPPLLIFHWLIQCDHPSLFSTDLFSVTGVWAVCGDSWLGCGDCQPWEQYFSSGALVPNLHKAMQMFNYIQVAFVQNSFSAMYCMWLAYQALSI